MGKPQRAAILIIPLLKVGQWWQNLRRSAAYELEGQASVLSTIAKGVAIQNNYGHAFLVSTPKLQQVAGRNLEPQS